jgi:hypothetical protein
MQRVSGASQMRDPGTHIATGVPGLRRIINMLRRARDMQDQADTFSMFQKNCTGEGIMPLTLSR